MSRNGLLVLVALLAAAIALLVRLGRDADPAVAPAPDAPLLAAFAEDALREIALDCDGRAVTLGLKAAGSWRITRPFDAEADPRRVDDLVASLANARVKKVVGDGADRDAFGLGSTACTVRLGFGADAPAVELRLGRSSPIGTERYAATDDSRVVLTDGNVFGAVSRRAEAFREKRLFPVDPEAISRIVLDRPDGSVIVSREGGVWRMEAPYADAASSGTCSGLARAVAAIEVVVPDAVAAPTNSLPSRRLRVELAMTGGGATRVAFVAAAGIDGKRLAWRDGAGLAGLVDETGLAELTRDAASFRDRRITSFSSPDVRRLTIERKGEILRIERPGEGSPWTGLAGAVAFPVDAGRVDAVLDRLRGLSASGFESATPPSPPAGTLVIDGQATTLARVTWGSLARTTGADGGDLWLTTPERPGVVFRMSAASFGPIPESAADFAPPTIPEVKAAEGS